MRELTVQDPINGIVEDEIGPRTQEWRERQSVVDLSNVDELRGRMVLGNTAPDRKRPVRFCRKRAFG
jgi:hypothetical protein